MTQFVNVCACVCVCADCAQLGTCARRSRREIRRQALALRSIANAYPAIPPGRDARCGRRPVWSTPVIYRACSDNLISARGCERFRLTYWTCSVSLRTGVVRGVIVVSHGPHVLTAPLPLLVRSPPRLNAFWSPSASCSAKPSLSPSTPAAPPATPRHTASPPRTQRGGPKIRSAAVATWQVAGLESGRQTATKSQIGPSLSLEIACTKNAKAGRVSWAEWRA